MKKAIYFLFIYMWTTGISVFPALSEHSNPHKSSIAHSDTQHHYYHHKNLFSRHGDHENHNPHHRNCGAMPGGGC